MWPYLWRIIATLAIMYSLVSYVIVFYSFFINDEEKAKQIPLSGKILFTILAPFVFIAAMLIPSNLEDK